MTLGNHIPLLNQYKRLTQVSLAQTVVWCSGKASLCVLSGFKPSATHFFLHNKKTRIAHLGCGLTWAVNWTCLALSPRAHGSAQAQRPRPQPSGRPSQPSRARMDRPISTAHSPAAGAYPSPTRVHGPAQLACAWAGPAHPVHSPVAAACPHMVVVTCWCC